ncbi:hypothetical protein ACFOEW_02330 [Alteromonas oceani]|uniref:Lipoprotein n=1 Tax=Alteromonas oceani TaxID=2071609 RepID=A0ABV7JRE3_9ALTE|nr:hypothetical protein [Alteromonas oceani]
MKKYRLSALALLLGTLAIVGCSSLAYAGELLAPGEPIASPLNDKRWQRVSGQAVHFFPTVILHSSRETEAGKTERSTDTIDLTGDLNGRIVYHVTSLFDYAAGTLVNTGHQVFSGTVSGGEPVLLLDDNFIFTVDLNNGDTLGKVFLTRTLTGTRTQCRLTVTGTGFDAQGNGLADYSGYCRHYGRE